MRRIGAVWRKELRVLRGAMMLYAAGALFLAFAAFYFFHMYGFAARDIATVRPFFGAIPPLLSLFVAVLCMRTFPEERRRGTWEVLRTLPLRPGDAVVGTYGAVFTVALGTIALTLPVVLGAGLLGELDWGVVAGEYLAAILLAATVTAICIFVAVGARSQVWALLGSVLVLFAILYAPSAAAEVGLSGQAREVVRAVGMAPRFDDLIRGVLDTADVAYFVVLTAAFLYGAVIRYVSTRREAL